MKKCPACLQSLHEKTVSGHTVDICSTGCGGIWFDQNEIKDFDEPNEPNIEENLAENKIQTDPEKLIRIRKCPCCDDQIMVRRSYDIFGQVEVDQCLKCSGLWLDKGELETIRHQFPSEEERNRVSDEFLSNKLAETKQEINERIKFNEQLSEQEKKSNRISHDIMKKLYSLYHE